MSCVRGEGAFMNFFNNIINPGVWLNFLYVFPILLISVALHEFAHCWVVYRLGDPSPKSEKRITLNPLAHLDPLGTIMMVVTVISGWGLGWGRPTPMNPGNFRNPARDRMISALVGPLSNVLQMFGWASLLLLLGGLSGGALPAVIGDICWAGVWVNGFLAAFNLIPIYPLDGHHILSYFAPPAWRPIIDHPAWIAVFYALVFVPILFQYVLSPILIPLQTAIMSLNQFVFGVSF